MPKINYNLSPRFKKLNTKIRYDLCPRFQKKKRTIKKTLTVGKVLIHHGGKVYPLGEPCKFCDKVKREANKDEEFRRLKIKKQK